MFGLIQNLFKRPRPSAPPNGSPPGATIKAAGASSTSLRGVTIDTGAPLFNGAPVPVYPDKGPAVPSASPQQLLDSQKTLVNQLRDTIGLPPEQFDRLVLPVLLRFAAYAHLLPASENHHHCGQGGLLRHSLEVAFYSTRHTESMVYAMHREPAIRRHIELRYRLATLFAGLMHDLGKLVMDLGVVDATGEQRWSAHEGPLYEWLVARRLPGYYIFWKAGERHRRHESAALGLMREILGKETIAFLCEHEGTEVMDRLNMALVNAQDSHNPITPVVCRYDAFSVDDDERSTRDRLSAIAQGDAQKLAVRLLQVMRRLLREKRWAINAPGAHVWVTDLGVFINNPEVLRNTIEVMLREGEVGIPTDPAHALMVMARSGFFTPVGAREFDSDYLWSVSVCVPASATQSAWINLTAPRFERADLLFADLPVPSAIAARTDVKRPATTPMDVPAATQAPLNFGTPDTEVVSIPPAPESAALMPEREREVHVVDRRAANDATRQHYVEGRRESDKPVTSEVDAKSLLAEHEREGVYLQHAIDMVREGVLVWGKDITVIDGRVILAHERVFEDAGIDPSHVLGMFRMVHWIEPNAATPDKVVVSFEGSDGQSRKGLRFSVRMSTAILQLVPPTEGALPTTPVPDTLSTAPPRPAQPPQSAARDLLGDVDISASNAAEDQEHLKTLLWREMNQSSERVRGGVVNLDEPSIQLLLSGFAKRVGAEPQWLQDVVMTSPRPLLVRRTVGNQVRLAVNSRFKADSSIPKGFYERFPNAPGGANG